jgi:hypothetical protein
MAQVQKDSREQHVELLALLAAYPDLTDSDSTSVSRIVNFQCSQLMFTGEWDIIKLRAQVSSIGLFTELP